MTTFDPAELRRLIDAIPPGDPDGTLEEHYARTTARLARDRYLVKHAEGILERLAMLESLLQRLIDEPPKTAVRPCDPYMAALVGDVRRALGR